MTCGSGMWVGDFDLSVLGVVEVLNETYKNKFSNQLRKATFKNNITFSYFILIVSGFRTYNVVSKDG